MTKQDQLERLADTIECLAREIPHEIRIIQRGAGPALGQNGIRIDIMKELFALAWDIKQAARKGTPAENI